MMGSAKNTSERLASHVAENERGMAMLTVMIIMLLMVVLAISAITVTGLETRMSSFVTTKEAMSTAAESCEGTAVNVIQQALYYGQIQPEFLSNATPTAGPIPASNSATLFSEISGQTLPPPAAANTIGENFNDNASSAPNLQITNIPGLTVNGDIDRLFKRRKEGSGDLKEIVYRITCIASNAAAGTSITVNSVYSCTVGETCMKQIGGI